MVARKVPEVENKLIILLCVFQLGEVTNLQLLQFIAETDGMDYITMELALGELVESSQLAALPHPIGTVYALTEQGKKALDLFIDRLPASRRAAVEAASPAWKERFQKEKQMPSSFEQLASGQYKARLRLMEKDLPLVEIVLTLPSRDMAEHFCVRWPDKAQDVYEQLVMLLHPAAKAHTAQEGAACQYQEKLTGEYDIKADWDPDGQNHLFLHLGVPSLAMAQDFCSAWGEGASGFFQFLVRVLAK